MKSTENEANHIECTFSLTCESGVIKLRHSTINSRFRTTDSSGLVFMESWADLNWQLQYVQ